jgi:Restriction endonuclease/NACHT domain
MNDRSGKSFERRVSEVYQVLGYQVTRNVQLGGRQTDIVAKKQIRGASTITLAIECKDHERPVGNKIVDDFASVVIAQCAAGLITGGVMVSASDFTADARAAAEGQTALTLFSLEDLASQIFDVRYPLRELVERYEKEEIFQDYLPLKVDARSWARWSSERSEMSFDPLLQKLIDFDGKFGVGAMLVLADFGAGKTTLLHHIEYDRAKAHLEGEDNRIPLFLQLRDFRESQNIEALMRAAFRDLYYRDLPLGLLWQRVESGSFYLLLDGFDEMVDRSDATRRLELFHALVPLLRSPSPTILTSRPSYLVEKGELENLLEQIRKEEAATPAPVAGGTHKKVVAEQLRRQLFEEIREGGGRKTLDPTVKPPEIEVVRLRPLDRPQIEDYLAKHAVQLAEVDASPEDVLLFIDRTYDLTDLASRPMLLRLIVSTVLLGGVDLSDTSTQYGASGLYEMYTHAKLDHDVDKVGGRDGGLDLETRRRLAEAIALEMYRANSLEVDFQETLVCLAEESKALRRALSASRLSEGEIATDLAARSFVTLDRGGTCRFIHKSFRGFFVARTLKERLPKLDPMFNEPLEREVLYFLGGFDPTTPSVGKALWAGYRSAPKENTALRRNLLVAYLYTRPQHQHQKIRDAEIFEVGFGRLRFDESSMEQVIWRDATVLELELVKSKWKEVRLVDTHLVNACVDRGELEVGLEHAKIDAWRTERSHVIMTCANSTIEGWDVEGSSVRCRLGDGFKVDHLDLQEASMDWLAEDACEPLLGEVELSDSSLEMRGDIIPVRLHARNSVISYGSQRDLDGRWRLDRSVLRFENGPADQALWAEKLNIGLRTDPTSIILAPKGIAQSLLSLRAGIFGAVQADRGKDPIGCEANAWGAVEAPQVLQRIGLPEDTPGCVLGRLLLLWPSAYASLLAKALGAVVELEEVLADQLDFAQPETPKRVADLRTKVLKQHGSVLKKTWTKFEKYAKLPE